MSKEVPYKGIVRRVDALLAVTLLTACGSSSDVVDAARCGRLRDHVVDLRLNGLTDVDVAAHRAVLQRALGDDFVASCQRTLTAAELTCMLEAPTSAQIEACRRTSMTSKP
jgi:hypothetical protein